MTITATFRTSDGAEFDDELEAKAHDRLLTWATGYVAEHCGFKSDARLTGRARWLTAAIEAHQDEMAAPTTDTVAAMRAGVDAAAGRDPDATTEVSDADVAELRAQTDEGIAA